MAHKTDAELAENYNETQDLSEFDRGSSIPITVKRVVTISVRFSEAEIARLRERAESAGVKVTSFIRAAALDASSPVDRDELIRLARDLERNAHDAARLASDARQVGRGRRPRGYM